MDLLQFNENKYYDTLPLEKRITLSEKVRISDPSYRMDVWCAGTLNNVLPGEYECYVQYYSNRIARIEVRHINHTDIEPTELSNIDVGVDSGQCGIYDFDYFESKTSCDWDQWYDDVCNKTFTYIANPEYIPFTDAYAQYNGFFDKDGFVLDSLPLKETIECYADLSRYRGNLNSYETLPVFAADTIDGKALISSSGYGDGSYICRYGLWNEKIVSIGIWFLWEDDEI